jgi:hypothetical protein
MKRINLNLNLDKLKLSNGELKDTNPTKIVTSILTNGFGMWQQQQNGLLLTEQRKISKILDELEKGEDTIKIEDEEFNYLYDIFGKIKWNGATRLLVLIADELDRAKVEK